MEQGPADNPYVVNGKAFIDYGEEPRFEVNADGQQLYWGRTRPPAKNRLAQTCQLQTGLRLRAVFLSNCPFRPYPAMWICACLR